MFEPRLGTGRPLRTCAQVCIYYEDSPRCRTPTVAGWCGRGWYRQVVSYFDDNVPLYFIEPDRDKVGTQRSTGTGSSAV